MNAGGRLYVGSKIQVSLKNLDSYRAYTGGALNAAVYVTRSNGSKVDGVTVEQSGRDYYLTLVWDNMTAADLRDTYTVNVVLTRSQKLTLDLSPSVPRRVGSDGQELTAIDTARIGEAFEAFRLSGATSSFGNPILVGYSEVTSDAPYFSTQIREKQIFTSSLSSGANSPVYSFSTPENVQYINFNRGENDRILYNGKIYKGNERIWLSVEDLSLGVINFAYYDAAFLGVDSTMTATVVRTELYFDGDGDGKISGSYNATTGYFNLSSGTADRLVMMLEADESYNETQFQPQQLDNGKWGEHFLKIYYTMIPRNLTAPSDGAGAKAQVLPAFTTSVTNQTVYSGLTEEQQSYRYILPAVGADGARTSDNHPMYGAEASAVQFVDVPLGGDRHPMEHEGDEQSGYTFSWSPAFQGNLIYPFTNPDPIYIEHSLAGDNFPLANVTYEQGKGLTTDSAGRANLNGYLGSFAGDTTVALCVTEQTHTADQLKANPKTAETLLPESTELIRRSTTPDASYIAHTNVPSMGGAEVDPSGSGNDYASLAPRYGMDVKMATLGLLGYVTVLTNKDEVMLTVSVPVLSTASTNGGENKRTRFPETVEGPQEKQWGEVSGLMQGIRDKGDISALKDAFEKSGYKAMEGGGLSSTKISGSLSVSIAYTFKYDSVTNAYYFKEFAAGVVGGIAFKYTYRLSVFPLVYFYVSVNINISVTTGAIVKRTMVERDVPYIEADQARTVKKNESFGINTKFQVINIEFTGKLYVEVLDKEGGTVLKDANCGMIISDGGKRGTLRLGGENSKSDMTFGAQRYIRFTALEDSTVHYLNVVERDREDVYWSGVKISPKLQVEVGAGAGVDFLKVEACVKIVATANITFGAHKTEGGFDVIKLQSAKFAIALTVRAVAFSVSTEMDAVGVTLYYTDGSGWRSTYTLWGDEAALSGDGGSGFLRPVEDTSGTQRIYSPSYGEDAALTAYEADDPAVPFQLSGYNSSVSAFKLADGLALGYDYQVVTVNGENYVLYTIGRANAAGALDRPMLVCSRLVSTGGMGSVGLVNPLDDINPVEGSTRSETPYILVDTLAGGGDDGTGDLEFSVQADGSTIRAAWVSYDAAGIGTDSGDFLREASKHTVVKTASFDTAKKEGFTPAETVSGAPGNRVLQPAVLADGVIAWVKAEPMTDAERAAASANYASALAAAGFDPNSSDPAIAQIGQGRLATQQMLWDSAGKRSSIRGSKDRDQAVTVTLGVSGAGMPETRLLSWTVTENIVPGQKVALGGDFTLPQHRRPRPAPGGARGVQHGQQRVPDARRGRRQLHPAGPAPALQGLPAAPARHLSLGQRVPDAEHPGRGVPGQGGHGRRGAHALPAHGPEPQPALL